MPGPSDLADTWPGAAADPPPLVESEPEPRVPLGAELQDAASHTSGEQHDAELQHALRASICRTASGREIGESLAAQVSEHVQHTFLPGFIKKGLEPVGRAISKPFSAIISLAFSQGPVSDLMADIIAGMLIPGLVKRSMPSALSVIISAVIEDLVFAVPPIITLAVTAATAERLKSALTAAILRATTQFLDDAQPAMISNLQHAIVHSLHNGLTTAALAATAAPLTHALSTSLSTSLTHFYYCSYCYYYKDYCRYCQQNEAYQQIGREYWQSAYKPHDAPGNVGDPTFGRSRAYGPVYG